MCPARAHRAKFGRVAEHFAERDFRLDDAGVSALLAVDDQAAPAIQVAGDVADEVFGRGDDDFHDRLEQRHAGLVGQASLKAIWPANSKAICELSTW